MYPFDELYWNLNQLVAWVYLRDRRAVDRAGGAEPDWEIEDPADSPDQPTRIPAPEEGGDEGPKFNMMKEREAVWGRPITDVNMDMWAAEHGGARFESSKDAEDAILNQLRQNKLMFLVSESDGPNGQTSPTDPEVEFLDRPRFYYNPPRLGRWPNPRFRREEALALWPSDLAQGADQDEPGPRTDAEIDATQDSAPEARQSGNQEGTATSDDPSPVNIYSTGLAGKPTIKHLILSEFERRVTDKEFKSLLSEEAKELQAWAKSEHPKAPNTTNRTIENHIRSRHREAKSNLKSTKK